MISWFFKKTSIRVNDSPQRRRPPRRVEVVHGRADRDIASHRGHTPCIGAPEERRQERSVHRKHGTLAPSPRIFTLSVSGAKPIREVFRGHVSRFFPV